MKFFRWLRDVLKSGTEESSKRTICFVLVFVYIVSHFLVMYLKIQIANKDLVESSQDGLYWLILVFGGFIAAEPVLSRLKIGGAKTLNVDRVEKQEVQADNVNILGDGEPKVGGGKAE